VYDYVWVVGGGGGGGRTATKAPTCTGAGAGKDAPARQTMTQRQLQASAHPVRAARYRVTATWVRADPTVQPPCGAGAGEGVRGTRGTLRPSGGVKTGYGKQGTTQAVPPSDTRTNVRRSSHTHAGSTDPVHVHHYRAGGCYDRPGEPRAVAAGAAGVKQECRNASHSHFHGSEVTGRRQRQRPDAWSASNAGPWWGGESTSTQGTAQHTARGASVQTWRSRQRGTGWTGVRWVGAGEGAGEGATCAQRAFRSTVCQSRRCTPTKEHGSVKHASICQRVLQGWRKGGVVTTQDPVDARAEVVNGNKHPFTTTQHTGGGCGGGKRRRTTRYTFPQQWRRLILHRRVSTLQSANPMARPHCRPTHDTSQCDRRPPAQSTCAT
jgi:hypothetical protein